MCWSRKIPEFCVDIVRGYSARSCINIDILRAAYIMRKEKCIKLYSNAVYATLSPSLPLLKPTSLALRLPRIRISCSPFQISRSFHMVDNVNCTRRCVFKRHLLMMKG
jgi:hypothetical protein